MQPDWGVGPVLRRGGDTSEKAIPIRGLYPTESDHNQGLRVQKSARCSIHTSRYSVGASPLSIAEMNGQPIQHVIFHAPTTLLTPTGETFGFVSNAGISGIHMMLQIHRHQHCTQGKRSQVHARCCGT